jgi:hypothetical protein
MPSMPQSAWTVIGIAIALQIAPSLVPEGDPPVKCDCWTGPWAVLISGVRRNAKLVIIFELGISLVQSLRVPLDLQRSDRAPV